ncbi:MAG: UvrD-helicase domain-containing protein [bacterium]
MHKNTLVIAAAGSGKTSFLVNEARNIKHKKVLITTYTEANEGEIIKKFAGRIPANVTIQTWFSFLLKHGVRPFQSIMDDSLHHEKIGFYLTEKQSGFRYNTTNGKPVYWGEKDFMKFYFTRDFRIYSDKISKFIIDCNKKSNGAVINRVSRVFSHIFVDEVQDLAGWELELLKLLFTSRSTVLLVGDPRQVTYLTHHSPKYDKYREGMIKDFVRTECNKREQICEIDEQSLLYSHRNNEFICDFSSALFPEHAPSKPCDCRECRSYNFDHQGIFAVKPADAGSYFEKYHPQILRYNKSQFPDLNFGMSKGLGFDSVLIYPTEKIGKYLTTGDLKSIETVRAKFYVAITRARQSVGIVCDFNDNTKFIRRISKYIRSN